MGEDVKKGDNKLPPNNEFHMNIISEWEKVLKNNPFL